jgi:glyoxylate reductase
LAHPAKFVEDTNPDRRKSARPSVNEGHLMTDKPTTGDRRPLVVETTPVGTDILEALDFAEVVEIKPGQSRRELLDAVAGADAILNPGDLKIDAELLDGSPNLRIIANVARGYDNLDLDELASRGIWATNVPDAFTASTAEVTIGLLLMVMRRMAEGDAYVRRGGWDRFVPGEWDGNTLVGKTIGIVGYGLIGQAVARRARAFDMNVIYHQRTKLVDSDTPWYPLPDLLAASDVVSLHAPLTPETTFLMNAETLGQMKKGSVLINTARGRMVEEQALLDALQSGWLGGAGLDVVEHEPAVGATLRELQNVVITPHLGGGTLESRRAAQVHAVANVAAVLQGHPPVQPLNSPATTIVT